MSVQDRPVEYGIQDDGLCMKLQARGTALHAESEVKKTGAPRRATAHLNPFLKQGIEQATPAVCQSDLLRRLKKQIERRGLVFTTMAI